MNSKWVKNVSKEMKLLEENIGKAFSDINCTNVVLGQSPKPVEIKPKVNQWNLFKFISFFTEKETINKRKRQPTDWEKPFANEETNKGFVVVVQSLSCIRLFRNSMNCSLPGPSVHEISRQEYWSGLPFPSPGIFLMRGSKSPALTGGFFTAEPPEKPII